MQIPDPRANGKRNIDPVARRMYLGHLRDQLVDEPTQYEAPERGDQMRALYALHFADLTARAKKVGAWLIWHANAKTGRCDPSLSRLATLAKIDRRNVLRALDELREAGIIRREIRISGQNKNSTTAYHLQWDALRRLFAAWESKATGKPNGEGVGAQEPLTASQGVGAHLPIGRGSGTPRVGAQQPLGVGAQMPPKHYEGKLNEGELNERTHALKTSLRSDSDQPVSVKKTEDYSAYLKNDQGEPIF